MSSTHIHLLSDSTGETLELIAKACLAQFENDAAVKHQWPMVRTEGSLDRVLEDIAEQPGLVLFTIASHGLRAHLESRARQLGLKTLPVLDPVLDALSAELGQEAAARPGRQHAMDAAYFARVEAIQFTIAHDDGMNPENWEEAEIVLAGVSRSSKTPTSIYLANRGYKTANIPIVPEAPLPDKLFALERPLVVGLTVSAERLIQIRRNRLLGLGQAPETSYVDGERVREELAVARRIYADNGWPVIDVTRRSIEETAAAVIRLLTESDETRA
ncbi:MAG: pyruvate, water dikinase regulatory protein [Sphingomonadaceae bacterium]